MLTDTEREKISIYLGYPASFPTGNERVLEKIINLNITQQTMVRSSLAEIERLEELIKAAVTHNKAIQVEEIKLNGNWRDSLMEAAALEIDRIAHILQIEVLGNYYRPSENKFKPGSDWMYFRSPAI